MSALQDFNISEKSRELKILILSDLHFKGEDNEVKTETPKRKAIISSLFETLAKLDEPKDQFDLILVPGDLANSASMQGYQTFIELINALREFPNFSHAIVFTCPGNHDLDREYKKDDKKINYKQSLQSLLSSIAVDDYHHSYTKEALADMIYSSLNNIKIDREDASGKNFFHYLKDFEDHAFNTYLSSIREVEVIDPRFVNKIESLNTVYHAEVLGIDLLSVNSSWFCGLFNRDKEKLFLILPVIKKLVEDLKKKKLKHRTHKNVTLALMHHPYSWFHESEFNDVTGSEMQSFTLLSDNIDIFVSGHEHGEFKRPHTFNDQSHIIINGCTYTNDRPKKLKVWPSTFGILRVNKISKFFSLKRFRLVQITDEIFEWKSHDNPGNDKVPYLRKEGSWNFSINEELFFQTTQSIFFIKGFILKDVPEREWTTLLLEKQLSDIYDTVMKLTEVGSEQYLSTGMDNNKAILLPRTVLLKNDFNPIEYIKSLPRELREEIKPLNKVTFYLVCTIGKQNHSEELKRTLETYMGDMAILNKHNNYFGAFLPFVFSHRILLK